MRGLLQELAWLLHFFGGIENDPSLTALLRTLGWAANDAPMRAAEMALDKVIELSHTDCILSMEEQVETLAQYLQQWIGFYRTQARARDSLAWLLYFDGQSAMGGNFAQN